MDLGISGKRAIVLGSTGGLGHEIARTLAREGVSVLVTGRSEARVAAALAVLGEETGPDAGRAHGLAADLSDPVAVEDIHARAVAAMGGVDILINNTGGPPPGAVSSLAIEEWTGHFATMVAPVMAMTALCLPGMRAQRWGRIVTLLSSGVVQPIPNLGISNALRSSLLGWSKTLAGEVAGDRVTVNTLVPGRIATERTQALDEAASKRQGKTVEEIAATSRGTIPLGRYGRVDEFAAVAAFLVSERASYVTGSMLRVDGGMICSI